MSSNNDLTLDLHTIRMETNMADFVPSKLAGKHIVEWQFKFNDICDYIPTSDVWHKGPGMEIDNRDWGYWRRLTGDRLGMDWMGMYWMYNRVKDVYYIAPLPKIVQALEVKRDAQIGIKLYHNLKTLDLDMIITAAGSDELTRFCKQARTLVQETSFLLNDQVNIIADLEIEVQKRCL